MVTPVQWQRIMDYMELIREGYVTPFWIGNEWSGEGLVMRDFLDTLGGFWFARLTMHVFGLPIYDKRKVTLLERASAPRREAPCK